MALLFGLIAYIGLVALIIGYFFIKKLGDRHEQKLLNLSSTTLK
jgi:hypothetical protein